MNLGSYIKEKRTEKSISARELSRRSGISQPYLSQLENGKNDNPSIEALKKLSKGLGVSYTQLLEMAGHLPEGETERQKNIAKSARNNQEDIQKSVGSFKETIELDKLLKSDDPISFNGQKFSPEQRNQVLTILGAIFPN
jgi:transcriptional regulator with XRE-family HTH domain